MRSGEARIVYCSPERFASNFFLEALAQRRIDLIAVDEAHCVSEWGHDFRPDYLRLPQIADRLGRPTVMACTATATKPVAAEIASRFGMREPLQVRSGFDRPNLSFDVVPLEGHRLQGAAPGAARGRPRRPRQPPGDRLLRHPQGHRRGGGDAARSRPERARPTTPAWKPEQRSSVQQRFMGGDVDVIVATNAFGMGVDKADVRSVWHMAIPTSVEAYYQEAGRAGRDGLPARAVLLAMKMDLGRLVRFNEQRAGDPELAIAHERGWRAYHAIKAFIYSGNCRRRSLLDHFGDRLAGAPLERCCDVCDAAELAARPGDDRDPPDQEARAAPPPRRPTSPPPTRRCSRRSKPGACRPPPASPPTPSPTTAPSPRSPRSAPPSEAALIEISGVGPSFISKYADEVLAIDRRPRRPRRLGGGRQGQSEDAPSRARPAGVSPAR